MTIDFLYARNVGVQSTIVFAVQFYIIFARIPLSYLSCVHTEQKRQRKR